MSSRHTLGHCGRVDFGSFLVLTVRVQSSITMKKSKLPKSNAPTAIYILFVEKLVGCLVGLDLLSMRSAVGQIGYVGFESDFGTCTTNVTIGGALQI